eukprot:6234-Heterococcus_DN1.PRE.2
MRQLFRQQCEHDWMQLPPLRSASAAVEWQGGGYESDDDCDATADLSIAQEAAAAEAAADSSHDCTADMDVVPCSLGYAAV